MKLLYFLIKNQILRFSDTSNVNLIWDRRLCLFEISSELINCKHCTSTNDHKSQITVFHDRLVIAMSESMAVHIPHSGDSLKTNVISGWDAEVNVIWRNNDLFYIIIFRNNQEVYMYMRRCCIHDINTERFEKEKKQPKHRQYVSKDLLRSDYKNYWKTVKLLRMNAYKRIYHWLMLFIVALI